jgi:hypothetical protein
MKGVNLFWILGAAAVAGGAYYLYTKSQAPKTASSLPAGETTQYLASYDGQVINMKVGDSLSTTTQTTAPTIGGSSVFGGAESGIITPTGATATIAGTETLTWPGMTVTVNVT